MWLSGTSTPEHLRLPVVDAFLAPGAVKWAPRSSTCRTTRPSGQKVPPVEAHQGREVDGLAGGTASRNGAAERLIGLVDRERADPRLVLGAGETGRGAARG